MLGNDLVDLGDPETRIESFRPRFESRVFDPSERDAIAEDPDEHAWRWIHWAAKEAAYKLARQIDERFTFSPIKLVARFREIQSTKPGLREARGMMKLPISIEGYEALRERGAPDDDVNDISTVELRATQSSDWVHVLALPAEWDWETVVSGVKPLEPGAEQSRAVRDFAKSSLAKSLRVEPERLEIGRRGRIPTLERDGSQSEISLSLSHHGRFTAFAASAL